MRAVNLLPPEERRARSGAGRSGGLAYAVLGVLALAVVLLAARTITASAVQERHDELAVVQAEKAGVQSQLADLQAYTTFASLRESRLSTISSVAASRFDWAGALREVARTVPDGTWLSGLRATVNPETAVEGGATDALRAALPVPALEVKGCSTGQKAVALLVADLRRIDGVQRVSLSESVKSASGATAASAAGAGGTVDPCAVPGRPTFSLTVFFEAPATPTATPGAVTTGGTTP
jgi:Tfp pilus assembly protein PilN